MRLLPFLCLLLAACGPAGSDSGATAHRDDEGDPVADGCGGPVVVNDEVGFEYQATGLEACSDVQTWSFTVSYATGAYLGADLTGSGVVTFQITGPDEIELPSLDDAHVQIGNYIWYHDTGVVESADFTLRMVLDAVQGDLHVAVGEAGF